MSGSILVHTGLDWSIPAAGCHPPRPCRTRYPSPRPKTPPPPPPAVLLLGGEGKGVWSPPTPGGGATPGVVTWGRGHPGWGEGRGLPFWAKNSCRAPANHVAFSGLWGPPKPWATASWGGGGQGGRLGTRPSPTPGHFGGSSPLPPSFWHHWGGPRSGSSAPSPKQWPLPSSSITEGVPKVAPLPPPGSLGRPPVLPSPTWSAAQPPSTARTPWANKPPSSNPGAAITTSTQTPPTERRAHRAATPAERRARDGEKGKEGRGVEEAWPREGRGGAKGGRPERTTVPGGPRAAAVT